MLRTLENEPQRRYQAASEIKSDLESISATPNRAYAPTIVRGNSQEMASKKGLPLASSSIQQQEAAARLLISRRELMDQVKSSLKPIQRGQIIQIIFGVILIALGAQCWARNTHVPHRLISGLMIHIYGVVMIGVGAHVLTRIGRMDYTQPIQAIRGMLGRVRGAYLLGGPVTGFPWWLMWLPLFVSFGFDAVMNPYCFWVSLAVGIPGLGISMWLYLRYVVFNENPDSKWQKQFVGQSIAHAYEMLDEIERAGIN